MLNALRLMGTLGMTVEEVDRLHWAGSGLAEVATFRTADYRGSRCAGARREEHLRDGAERRISGNVQSAGAPGRNGQARLARRQDGAGFYKKVKGEGEKEF